MGKAHCTQGGGEFVENGMSDELCQKLLDAEGTQEALSWLRAGSERDLRSIGELETTEESIQLVQLIYDAGAVQVLAVEIDELDDGQNTGALVIKLPSEAAKRKRLLEWAATIAEQQGLEAESDTGQQYLFLTLE